MNCLAGRRVAIVDPTAGVTRDRVSVTLRMGAGYIELFDTGGCGIEDRDNLTAHIARQIDAAIAEAALVLFVVDARQGITPLDRTVAEKLRRVDKPVILVANKVDQPGTTVETGELSSLGFGEPLPVSAQHHFGKAELLALIEQRVGHLVEARENAEMKLAIVGRRNVGKSTFINALAGSERVIVSEVPGTTRDSVDVTVSWHGRTFIAIDTAGLRKRSSVADDIDYYSQARAMKSIRRADVILLLLDAVEEVARVDKQILDFIDELYRPTVLVLNKWDLAQAREAKQEDYRPYLKSAMPQLSHAPVLFSTAARGEGVSEAIAKAFELFDQARLRVSTGQLNAAIEELTARHSPVGHHSGKIPRIYYATQTDVAPPTIVCFVNNVNAFDGNYQRYVLNQLHRLLPFPEIPIRLTLRPRKRRLTPHDENKTAQ